MTKTKAHRDRVGVLLQGAEESVAYRANCGAPVCSRQLSSIARISSALSSSASDTVAVDLDDLDCVHKLWRANARIRAGLPVKLLRMHIVASYITGLAFPFWLAPHWFLVAPLITAWLVYLYLPVVGLQYLLTGPWGELDGLVLGLSFAVAIQYSLFVVPSWYISRHVWTRCRTGWAYGLAVALLVAQWVYFSIAS